MKKSLFLFTTLLCLASSFASSTILSPEKLKATEIYFPIGKTGKKISLMDLSTISMDSLQSLTGRKLNFGEKISFRSAQRKLKRGIAPDGTIEKTRIARFFEKRGGEYGFHLGGFALGFFLGLIGLLIAYLIKDDYKQNRVKWAWIGFGIIVLIDVILIIASTATAV